MADEARYIEPGHDEHKSNFVQWWPGAKLALEVLKKISKRPMVKLAVGIIIRVGDAVYQVLITPPDPEQV